MLTKHLSCPVVFKQIDFTPCLSIVVLDTTSFQTDVSSIAIILEGRYLYLIESLWACTLYRISLLCCCCFMMYQKTITTHEIVDPPIVCHKKTSLRKFHRKTPVLESFFNKVAVPKHATLLKKRLWHRCFPVNFEVFLRTPFLWNTPGSCFWKQISYFHHIHFGKNILFWPW